ncbi:MAG: hypothetical protein JWP46_3446, partial [Modestobacter sp.]|nr:hypothetical protein [Modestobacter sp.]
AHPRESGAGERVVDDGQLHGLNRNGLGQSACDERQ